MPPDAIYNQWVASGQKHTGDSYKAVVYTNQIIGNWAPTTFTLEPATRESAQNYTGVFNGTRDAHNAVPLSDEDQAFLNATVSSLTSQNTEANSKSTSSSTTGSDEDTIEKRVYGNMLSARDVEHLARTQVFSQHHVAMGYSKAVTWRATDYRDGYSYPLNQAFLSTEGLCGCTVVVVWSPNGVLLAHIAEASVDPGQYGPWWINYPPTQQAQRNLDGIFLQEAETMLEQWLYKRNADGSVQKTPGTPLRDRRGDVIYDRYGYAEIEPGSRRPIWDDVRFPKQSTEAIIIAPAKDPRYPFHTQPHLTQEPRGQPMPNGFFHPPQVAGLQRMFRDWHIAYNTLDMFPRSAGPGRNPMFQQDSKDIVLLNLEESSRDPRQRLIRLYYDGRFSSYTMPMGRVRSPSPEQGSSRGGGSGGGGGRHGGGRAH